jgi:hypothetical protein
MRRNLEAVLPATASSTRNSSVHVPRWQSHCSPTQMLIFHVFKLPENEGLRNDRSEVQLGLHFFHALSAKLSSALAFIVNDRHPWWTSCRG